MNGRARPPLARPRSQRTGWGGLRKAGGDSPGAQRGEGGGAGARGVACEGGIEAGVSVRCVRACVEESCARAKRGDGTRAHAPTPRRGRAHPLALLGRSGGRPPGARPRKLFSARERAQVRDFFAARARAPAVPFRGALGLRVGRVWKGFCFPCSPHFPHCCGYWSSKKKGVAGGATGCAGETRTSASRSPLPLLPARTPARWPPHSRRPHRLKFPPLRFAFTPKMAPGVPPCQATHVPVPKPFSSPPPPLLPSQSLGDLLRRSTSSLGFPFHP